MTNQRPPSSRLGRFLAELKRRHVVRFALGYAAAAFVVLQLAEIVFPAFEIGETGLRILVVAVALLFPPSLVLAWIFDVTGEGLERTPDAPGARNRLVPGLALLGLSVVTVGAVWVWLAREGVLEQAPASAPSRAPGAEPTLVAYDPEAPIRSLAVLPLDDFSGDGGADYFTMGMQEELIAQLSQLPGLRVVSRTSVQRYAGSDLPVPRIGRELQVDAVIEGSVRRSGEQVRITVQLIHAASDTHVWTQQYDRALENVLALQSEVALDIARQIQAELSPDEASALQRVATRSVDPEAQDAYLRGRYEAAKGTPEGLAAAKDLFEAAVQEDSSFAPALAQLAGTRFLLGLADSALSAAEAMKAREEARRALALDTTSLEAMEVLRFLDEGTPSGWESATGAAGVRTAPTALTRSFPRPPPTGPAGENAPATPATDTAWFQSLSNLGRQIEVRVRSHGATVGRELDRGRFVGARGLMAAGMFTEAAEMLEALLKDAPRTDPAWELLARAELARGNPGGAVDAMERWSAQPGEGAPDAASVRALRSAVAQEGAAGYWRWHLLRLQAREAAGVAVPPTEIAAARAGSGDVEGAIRSLEEALARGDRGLVTLRKDPVWDVLRGDARFVDIARRSRTVHVGRDPGDRDAAR